jgi:hypothetical protein
MYLVAPQSEGVMFLHAAPSPAGKAEAFPKVGSHPRPWIPRMIGVRELIAKPTFVPVRNKNHENKFSEHPVLQPLVEKLLAEPIQAHPITWRTEIQV